MRFLRTISLGFASLGHGLASIGDGMASMFGATAPRRPNPYLTDQERLAADWKRLERDWSKVGEYHRKDRK